MSAPQWDDRMTLYYQFPPHWKSIPAVLQPVHGGGELEHYPKEGKGGPCSQLPALLLSVRTEQNCFHSSMLAGNQNFIKYFTMQLFSDKHTCSNFTKTQVFGPAVCPWRVEIITIICLTFILRMMSCQLFLLVQSNSERREINPINPVNPNIQASKVFCGSSRLAASNGYN